MIAATAGAPLNEGTADPVFLMERTRPDSL
jgi:hypothetical protein